MCHLRKKKFSKIQGFEVLLQMEYSQKFIKVSYLSEAH